VRAYLDLIDRVRYHGERVTGRNGETLSVFSHNMSFPLFRSFPLVTTKKVHFKSIAEELLWFVSGSTNNGDLRKKGVTIWDEWAGPDGELGPIYGKQWRNWDSLNEHGQHTVVDQLEAARNTLITDPSSRRIIVSAWNAGQIPDMALPPCHLLFQFYSRPFSDWDYRLMGPEVQDSLGDSARGLQCQVYQRSADVGLGVPFNIASYALLTAMMAKLTNHHPMALHMTFGDVHVYTDHLPALLAQTGRVPKQLPKLRIEDRGQSKWEDFRYEDFVLEGYDPHPPIKMEVSA